MHRVLSSKKKGTYLLLFQKTMTKVAKDADTCIKAPTVPMLVQM